MKVKSITIGEFFENFLLVFDELDSHHCSALEEAFLEDASIEQISNLLLYFLKTETYNKAVDYLYSLTQPTEVDHTVFIISLN